jgi:hypothetical protein
MSANSPWNEERLAELIALLKPPPPGWIEAAAQLPALRAVMDDLVARAERDAEFRAALVADLEAALAREGVEPTRRVLDELRSLLETD